MKHLFSLRSPGGGRTSWLTLLWLLGWSTAALAQPTYCITNLGGSCGVGNANVNLVAVGGTTCTAPAGAPQR